MLVVPLKDHPAAFELKPAISGDFVVVVVEVQGQLGRPA